MNKGIVVAGNLTADYVKTIDAYPGIGMLSNILSLSKGVGGCAANVAIDLAVLDPAIPVKSIGKVGNDENGRFVCETVKRYGVDISSVVIAEGIETSYTDVMTVCRSGERTFFHTRGANAKFSIDDIDFDSLQADMFHIGYALLLDSFDVEDKEYGTIMARTLFNAKKHGMMTSMDIVSENSDRVQKIVLPSLKYCDSLIINEIEASSVCGIAARDRSGILLLDNLKTMCGRLIDLGVTDRVVIHAPEMSCMIHRSGFYNMPSLELPERYIKGTVGAGDAFCAGMLYSIYKGLSPEQSLEVASCAGAACLSQENSIDGMKPLGDIMRLQEIYSRKSI